MTCRVTPEHGQERTLRGYAPRRPLLTPPKIRTHAWFNGPAKVSCDNAAAFTGGYAWSVSYPRAAFAAAIALVFAAM